MPPRRRLAILLAASVSAAACSDAAVAPPPAALASTRADGPPADAGDADAGHADADAGPSPRPIAALFGGGPLYAGGDAVVADLRGSGFDTIVLWSVHVLTNGDLVFNDVPVVSGGAYVGDPAWPARLAALRSAPTSVRRLELAVGAWSVPDFENVRALIGAGAADPGGVLVENFRVLRAATGADAVDFNDESLYDVEASVRFGEMLAGLGYALSFCAYTDRGFWRATRDRLAGKVDRIYLEAYDGGATTDPRAWSDALGMPVVPGLWGLHRGGGDDPAAVHREMARWRDPARVAGGFLWLYDDVLEYGPSTAAYAEAISSAF